MTRFDEIWKRVRDVVMVLIAIALVVPVVTASVQNAQVSLGMLAMAAAILGVPLFRRNGDK